MEDEFIAQQRPAWKSAILLGLMGFLGFTIIGSLVGVIVAIPFMEGGLFTFMKQVSRPAEYPQIKTPYMVMQSCVTLVGLAVVPALYWYGSEKLNPFRLLKANRTPVGMFLLTAVIMIAFLPVNSIFIEWNSGIKFPDFLGGFDSWARGYEDKIQELVTLFTTFGSFGEFLFSFFVIAVLAGFCEEVFFRGMLQPVLKTATGNIHVAIWLTAILFSSIHMEFFGFLPRVLLGALFGYLYYWSGNLWLAIIAHTVNNGVSVIVLYINQKQKLNLNLEDTDAMPVPAIIGGFIVFAILLFYFYRHYKTQTPATS